MTDGELVAGWLDRAATTSQVRLTMSREKAVVLSAADVYYGVIGSEAGGGTLSVGIYGHAVPASPYAHGAFVIKAECNYL